VAGTATRCAAGYRVNRPSARRVHRKISRIVTVDRTRTVTIVISDVRVHRRCAVLVPDTRRVTANAPTVAHRTLGVAATWCRAAKLSRIVVNVRVHMTRITNNVPATLERSVTVTAY
jgi:hypothetical protein